MCVGGSSRVTEGASRWVMAARPQGIWKEIESKTEEAATQGSSEGLVSPW